LLLGSGLPINLLKNVSLAQGVEGRLRSIWEKL